MKRAALGWQGRDVAWVAIVNLDCLGLLGAYGTEHWFAGLIRGAVRELACSQRGQREGECYQCGEATSGTM